MHSQFVFALSYRPFQSSGYHEDKRRLLELMLAREKPETFDLFRDVWETIRDDLKMPATSTPADVWDQLGSIKSFTRKGTLPKLSRWFSWNEAADEQAPSFNVLKLILRYHFGDGTEIDPDLCQQKKELDQLAHLKSGEEEDDKNTMRKQFNILREKVGGGLKLAFHIMSNRLLQRIHVIRASCRPVWTWYSSSVKGLKNPADQVVRLIELARSWESTHHLKELAGVPISECDEVKQLLLRDEFAEFREDTPARVASLSLRLLQQRVWSLSRASAPPDCYAELLSDDLVSKQACRSGTVDGCIFTGDVANLLRCLYHC